MHARMQQQWRSSQVGHLLSRIFTRILRDSIIHLHESFLQNERLLLFVFLGHVPSSCWPVHLLCLHHHHGEETPQLYFNMRPGIGGYCRSLFSVSRLRYSFVLSTSATRRCEQRSSRLNRASVFIEVAVCRVIRPPSAHESPMIWNLN